MRQIEEQYPGHALRAQQAARMGGWGAMETEAARLRALLAQDRAQRDETARMVARRFPTAPVVVPLGSDAAPELPQAAPMVAHLFKYAGWGAVPMPLARHLDGAELEGLAPILSALATAESDGWEVWQGEHLGSDGAPIDHVVSGRRAPSAPRMEDVGWCVEVCGAAGRRCDRHGRGAMVAGACTARCDAPRGTCSHKGGRTVGAMLRDMREESVKVPRGAMRRPVAQSTPRALDPSFGRKARPEPTDTVMAAGTWRTRLRAAPADSGKVLHYGWSVLARDGAPWADGRAPSMAQLRAHGYLLRVLNADGTRVKRTVPVKVRRVLSARDPRAGAWCEAQRAAREQATAQRKAQRESDRRAAQRAQRAARAAQRRSVVAELGALRDRSAGGRVHASL